MGPKSQTADAPKKRGPKGPRKSVAERLAIAKRNVEMLEAKEKVSEDPQKVQLWKAANALGKVIHNPLIPEKWRDDVRKLADAIQQLLK